MPEKETKIRLVYAHGTRGYERKMNEELAQIEKDPTKQVINITHYQPVIQVENILLFMGVIDYKIG